MSIVISMEFRKPVGFHGRPPFLSFFVKVQFQSPPIIRDAISDLSVSQLLSFAMNSS